MKEYLRSDGDTLTIQYTAATGTDSVVFDVYDLDLEEYIQSDEGTLSSGSTFNLVLTKEVAAYDRNVRIDIQAIDANTYTEDEMYASLVRPYATTAEIAEYSGYTIVSSNPGFNETTTANLVKLEKKARLYINAQISSDFKFQYKSVGTLGQGNDLLHLGQRIETFDKIIKDDEVVWDTTQDPEIDLLDYDLGITKSKTGLKVIATGENINEWADVSVLNSLGFFEKNSLYIVRGEYGWKYIPTDINEAALELVNDMLCTDFTYRNKKIKSIKNDSFTVELNPTSGTGNAIVDSILAGYQRWDMWAI